MDRLTEMEAFATVVDQGGFTDAAKKMGISKSAVSKHVSALEARLGVRLLNRTTRRVSPTEIGLAYYDRARKVLNDAGEADALVTSLQSAPAGKLRVSLPTDFGISCVSPVLSEFLNKHPAIAVDLIMSDQYVELISEGFDLAIRIGAGERSDLMTREICQIQRRLVASPAYLEQLGYPERIDALSDHQLLHYSSTSTEGFWSLNAPSGETRVIRTGGCFSANDELSLLAAAIDGLGIAFLPSFLYAAPLREGRLIDAMPSLPEHSYSVLACYLPNQPVAPKVSAFVEHLICKFSDLGPDDW